MFDLFVVLYLIVVTALGYSFGVFRRGLHLAGFYGGLFIAGTTSPALTQTLGFAHGPYPAAAQFAVFLGELAFVVVAFEAIGFGFARWFNAFRLPAADGLLGAVTGGLMGMIELAVLVGLFNGMVGAAGPSGGTPANVVTTTEDQLQHSISGPTLIKLESVGTMMFLPVLPEQPTNFFTKAEL